MPGKRKRLPDWLRKRVPGNKNIMETRKILNEFGLNSVCQSAKCPNIHDCFSNRTATFMIMGNICTRDCQFCAVQTGTPGALDDEEPLNIARAVEKLGLSHVVITSVTRDDLAAGGAEHFVSTIKEIRQLNSEVIIEILTPDFKNIKEAIEKVVRSGPDIFNHNVETIPRLYERVRPQAEYERSLAVLAYVKNLNPDIFSKSGIMVGLGEKEREVIQVMQDLRDIDCDIFTIGQYLQPSKGHLPVDQYVRPEQFEKYRVIAEDFGFKYVAAGPLVRSSFHASDFSEKFI